LIVELQYVNHSYNVAQERTFSNLSAIGSGQAGEEMSVGDLRELESIFLAGRSPTAYIPYARALREARAFAKALEVCLRGLENDPDTLTGRLLLGEIYFDMGRYDAAVKILAEAQQRAPRSYRVNLMLVRVLVKRRELDKALEIIRCLKQEHPFDGDLMRMEKSIKDELDMESTSPLAQTKPYKRPAATVERRLGDLLTDLSQEKGVLDFAMVEPHLDEMAKGKASILTPRLRAAGEMARQLIAELLRLGGWALRQGVVEMTAGYVIFYAVNSRLLIIVADSSVSLGKLRYRVESFLSD
jgi:tetratricopeptide (TPR) repeat protein